MYWKFLLGVNILALRLCRCYKTPALTFIIILQEREFATWAPNLYVLPFGGSGQNRKIIKNYVC